MPETNANDVVGIVKTHRQFSWKWILSNQEVDTIFTFLDSNTSIDQLKYLNQEELVTVISNIALIVYRGMNREKNERDFTSLNSILDDKHKIDDIVNAFRRKDIAYLNEFINKIDSIAKLYNNFLKVHVERFRKLLRLIAEG